LRSALRLEKLVVLEAQVITYLKLSGLSSGLLKKGIRRLAYTA